MIRLCRFNPNVRLLAINHVGERPSPSSSSVQVGWPAGRRGMDRRRSEQVTTTCQQCRDRAGLTHRNCATVDPVPLRLERLELSANSYAAERQLVEPQFSRKTRRSRQRDLVDGIRELRRDGRYVIVALSLRQHGSGGAIHSAPQRPSPDWSH